MQIHRLTAHPARPAGRVREVNVTVMYPGAGEMLLRWRIVGAQDVIFPPYSGSGRADDLWKTTCCEMFIDLGGGAYREFNFSPSGRWAAYDFASYRVPLGNTELRDSPVVSFERGSEIAVATVKVPVKALAGARHGTFAAVIEENGGVTSFWANAHRQADPDFHDASCFTSDFAPPQTR